MNSSMNYYDLLGVSEKATTEEIKLAYKKQMKKWHPDVNKSQEAPTMAKKIIEAKNILLDDEKRKAYDLSLKQEVHDNYNKYNYHEKKSTNEVHKETRMVSKWEYFKEYLKFGKASNFRKFLAILGVGIESFICFIIKFLLIGIAIISSYGSYFIMMSFNLLAPIFGILLLIIVGTVLTRGFMETITDSAVLILALVLVGLYVLMLLLPVVSRKVLSPKVFDILYNKIDINLFKKCVGFKE